MQSIQDLKNSVDRIEAQLNAREKGKFPAQPQSNPKGHHEQHEQVNLSPPCAMEKQSAKKLKNVRIPQI